MLFVKTQKKTLNDKVCIYFIFFCLCQWVNWFYLLCVPRRNNWFVVLALFNKLSYSPVGAQIGKVHLIKDKEPCSHSLNGQTVPT